MSARLSKLTLGTKDKSAICPEINLQELKQTNKNLPRVGRGGKETLMANGVE